MIGEFHKRGSAFISRYLIGRRNYRRGEFFLMWCAVLFHACYYLGYSIAQEVAGARLMFEAPTAAIRYAAHSAYPPYHGELYAAQQKQPAAARCWRGLALKRRLCERLPVD